MLAQELFVDDLLGRLFEVEGVECFAWFAGVALLALTAETVLDERVSEKADLRSSGSAKKRVGG